MVDDQHTGPLRAALALVHLSQLRLMTMYEDVTGGDVRRMWGCVGVSRPPALINTAYRSRGVVAGSECLAGLVS